jgi:predicted nucleic acid-binding Zn ribbon protein
MEIFIHRDGQDSGPYSPGEIRDRIASGRLKPTDMAWYEGLPDWVPLSQIRLPPAEEAALAVLPPTSARMVQVAPPALPVARVEPSRNCPFCAEPIKPDALKCKHCGEILDPRLRAAEEAKRAAAGAMLAVAAQKQQPTNVTVKTVVNNKGRRSYGCGDLIIALILLFILFCIISAIFGSR